MDHPFNFFFWLFVTYFTYYISNKYSLLFYILFDSLFFSPPSPMVKPLYIMSSNPPPVKGTTQKENSACNERDVTAVRDQNNVVFRVLMSVYKLVG